MKYTERINKIAAIAVLSAYIGLFMLSVVHYHHINLILHSTPNVSQHADQSNHHHRALHQNGEYCIIHSQYNQLHQTISIEPGLLFTDRIFEAVTPGIIAHNTGSFYFNLPQLRAPPIA